jgi:hypothetical protein
MCQDDEIEIAIDWATNTKTSELQLICVVVRSFDQLDLSTRLKGKPSSVLYLCESQLKDGAEEWPGGPVVALWPTNVMLENLEADSRASSIVAIPWFPSEVRGWAETQRAVNLYDTDWWKLDGVVVQAQSTRLELLARGRL